MDPLTQTERDWGQLLVPDPREGCLEAEQLLALAAKSRRAPQAEALLAHIAACPSCRRALKELRALDFLPKPAARPGFPWPRLFPWAAGLAAAAVVLFLAVQWLGRSSESPGKNDDFAKESAPKRSAATPNLSTPPRELTNPPLPPGRGLGPVNSKPNERRGSPPLNRTRKNKPAPAIPVPIVDRTVETMDANAGWGRDEISGEVLGGNVATGEVVSPNQVQGEVAAKRGA